MEKRSTRYPVLVMLALCAVGFIPYLLALHGFFSNDDWVLLWHYGRIPLSRAWEFFSPRTIWFYRPLQSLQFGIFHQAFGLNSAPYNLALLLAHAACCVLVFQLIRRFTQRLGSPLLPWLATAAFSLQWIYLDMLLWKANFNTFQWALVTLAACVCFSRYLDERSPRFLWATYGLTVLNFFTKEQAVNLPVLLALLWLFQPRTKKAEAAAAPDLKARLLEAVRLLAPVAVLVLLYVVAHRLFIKDIYVQQKPGYFFVGPGQAVLQTLHIYNHALLSFLYEPLFQGTLLSAQRSVTSTLGGGAWALLAVVPAALTVLAVKTRDRALGLGLAWILASYLPCIFLKDYHASRFYYLPAAGAALVTARLAEMAWNAASRLAARPQQLAFRGAVGAAVLLILAANFHQTLTLIQVDGQQSDQVRAVFATLQAQRGKVAPGALVVLNAPPSYFGNGLGAREMAKFALKDPRAEAVADGQDMEPARVAELQRKPNVYLIDFSRAPLQVVQVKGGPRTAADNALAQR